ncbi:MAG: 50S ribosomal protein L4 [Chitinophagales bacterium]
MKVQVLNQDGKGTGREVELSDSIFGVEPNDHAVWLAVRQFQAAQRQGTHKSKERWEIARTTKKAFRQKGTGGARRGDMKSPLVRGGGRVFGPKPHSYDFKLNKKVKDTAKKTVFTYKAKDNNIIIVDDLKLGAIKTKDFTAILKNLNVAESKSLILIGEANKNVFLSSRNIPNALVADAVGTNVFDMMSANKIILTEAALKAIETNFQNN